MTVLGRSAAPGALADRHRPRLRGLRELGPGAWIAIGVLLVVAVMAIFGPLLVSADPNALSLSDAFGGPQPGHLLGFDSDGRDLLSRIVHAARTAIIGPFIVVTVSTALGTTMALAAAWWGGWFDSVLARVVDAMFAFPALLLAILAAALFGAGLTTAGIALAIAYTPYVARIIRSAALRERALPYVAALTVQGVRGITINLRHILPNLAALVTATAALSFGYALIDLSALSFIGLGVQPPTSDWGVMVATGVSGILQHHPQESLYASAMIVITVVAANVLGDRISGRSEEAR